MPRNPENPLLRSILLATALLLSSCATQKQEIKKAPVPSDESEESELSVPSTSKVPAQSVFKDGEELRLVRVMEGGACNDDDQGARGLFLVYAEPGDIDRIKKDKGTQIFEQFEHDIEDLSLAALQASVDEINFGDNPFALDIEDSLQQAVQQIIANFKAFSRLPIEEFEFNTGLTIDVLPFPPSMGFILDNCNETMSETPESE